MDPQFTITLTDPEASNGGGTGGVHVVGSDLDYSEITKAIANEESIDFNEEEASSLMGDMVIDFHDMISSGMNWCEIGFKGSDLVLQFAEVVEVSE